MPVPWPSREGPAQALPSRGVRSRHAPSREGPPGPRRIPEVENRAITVQQLRDLQLFLQRLCKVGLLWEQRGDGTRARLHWFQVNMYHIRDLIIKPVIEYVEGSRPDRYSWVELVAATGETQQPRIMFSHSWGGRFRDFMAVVEHVCSSRGFSARDAIWVCTFANSQFGENFGPALSESPFAKAVDAAEGTVLVVDRDAGSLTRIWCALELWFTLGSKKKELDIYTPAGKVGSEWVTSGPLVEALENWDVTRCEASEDADRRQILNYLVRGKDGELEGLARDDHGNLVLKNGWQKELGNTELSSDWRPLRQDGRHEYVHEAALFRDCSEKFAKLSAQVQDLVMKAAHAGGRAPRVKFSDPDLTHRGVTLGQVRTFIKKVRAGLSLSSEWKPESWSVYQVAKSFVDSSASFMETVAKKPQRPQFIVDFSWDAKFLEFVSAFEWWAEARRLVDSSVVWIGFLSTRVDSDEDMMTFFDPLWQDVAGMVCCLPANATSDSDSKKGIARACRMACLHAAFSRDKQVDFSCPTGTLACSRPFPDGGWEFGACDPDLARNLVKVNWETAESNSQQVKDRARGIVEQSGGFAALGHRIARAVAGPVLRDAARSGGPQSRAEIRGLCTRSGFFVNSLSLRGSLGESAVHIAAAAGNVKALQLLLDFQADPNAEDHVRETPLHYAALTGQVRAVKCLLKRGAVASGESAFAETALQVAQQCPAAFLGVDTQAVCKLLEAWDTAADISDSDGEETASPSFRSP